MVKLTTRLLRLSFLWILSIMTGLFLIGISPVSAVTFSSTPAITSATFESTGSVTGLLVEFNRPVWNDAALTGGLATTDFIYTNGNAAGATSITAIAHTAGDDFAVLTLDIDPVAGDTADTISAVTNNIFTVGGALSEAAVALTDDAGTAPTITSATVLNGKPRILVTFSKRVWSDDTSGAPPTTAVANADFAYANGGSAEGCETALGTIPFAPRPGSRSVLLDCGENAAAAETGDTLDAASGTALNDLWGNDMAGTGGPAVTQDAAAPTIIRVEAVKDSTKALITFSEPVFTDDPTTGTGPATIAGADFTYTDGSGTVGAASIASIAAAQLQMGIGTGSGNSYALITLNAAASVADLSGGAADDTLDVAASGTAVFDANGNGLATGGATANRTLNDTTRPVILTATLDKTGATGQNTLALLYSEDVQATGFTAGGESIASTTTIGNMTTACTPVGFGAFSGNSGSLTYATLLNTVALNAAQTTFTITLAAQNGGYRTSTAAAVACTDNSGDTFTPTAVITDLAPTVNTIEVTSLIKTHTITNAWDVANPLTAQVTTPSSATTAEATIGWTAVTDGGGDFREYKFFYGTTTGAGALLAGTQWGRANDTALNTRTTTTTTLTGLTSGTIYFITPYVFDTFGNAAAAATEINLQTNSAAGDRTAPAAPTNVKVESKDGKAVLTWTDPTATDLDQILVLRGKNEFPVSGTAYAIVAKGVQTYTDSDVMVGDKVSYILRARDLTKNESVNSTQVEVTIVAAGQVAVGGETPPETPPTETPPETPPEEIPPEETPPEEVVEEITGGGYSGSDAPTWASDAVDEACDRELIDCTLDKPAFTTMVDRAVGYQMITKGFALYSDAAASPLSDVASKWFEQAAHTAYTVGLTAAQNGKFVGGENFTRAQIAVVVAKALGLPAASASVLDKYTDKNTVPVWAKGAVASMVKAGLLGGGGTTTLRPNDGVTKVETIVILNAAVSYMEENELSVLGVLAEKLSVSEDVLQEALDTGMNIVGGKLVDVE